MNTLFSYNNLAVMGYLLLDLVPPSPPPQKRYKHILVTTSKNFPIKVAVSIDTYLLRRLYSTPNGPNCFFPNVQ